MTLSEYYVELKKTIPPAYLSLAEKIIWSSKQIKNLQDQLSKEDLKTVTENEKRFQDKMNS